MTQPNFFGNNAIERAKAKLSIFTKALGYKNAPFHEEWYNYLQNTFSPLEEYPYREKRKLQLWPRGHGKSEATSFNYVSWLVGNNPDIHINIVTKTAALAENILLALITRFEHDEKYIAIFGELKPKRPVKWTTQEIIVNRNKISKNPTIKATGLAGPITGGRSDLIIKDDLIDEENVRTPLQFEKVVAWHDKVLMPTLYPWGGDITIGTRWHYADLYAELMKPNRKYSVSLKQAIQKDGSVLWPEYWSREKLDERRQEIGSIVFDCQYQNDPTSMEGSLLKASWLHAWNESNPNFNPPPNLPIYAGIDPSLGESDYFGIASLAYDARINQAYLLDVWAEHMPFPTIIKQVFPQLNSKYHYQKVFMETNFWQKLLTKMPELQGYPIVPVQTVKNKEERFIPMSSHFESKRVLVNPLLLNKGEFWTQWVQFPRGQHDDAVDCVELVVSKIVGCGPQANPSFLLM
jgi:predicted phage terminase large subunit-like protein